MSTFMMHVLQRVTTPFLARGAGVYSMSHGSGTPPEGIGSILIFGVLGGFCGLLVGFMLVQILRYVSLLMGRNLGGYSWVIVCAAVGSIVFGWIAAVSDKD